MVFPASVHHCCPILDSPRAIALGVHYGGASPLSSPTIADCSFDEVHFGGFAAKYIRRRYFMDVHPPLAKLLVTLSAFIGRFDGKFDFKDIGK